ncbi:hypothetical protein IG193_01695 [Infirmifilum lucidum]|uniref:Uncharacterized protein n=1 Tax=Infirmifilum lucidum TaxID=2776706 RepID=A0A7L9FHR7_9CREN|nr:hypothetical protein [Infirmifilum lucidum]QOJ79201.1 hypothetical protein IG193_01695 [Infirmifilum lucidum]
MTSIPAALLDIAALTYLGLLLIPLSQEHVRILALLPLLGPGYVIRSSVSRYANWDLLAYSALPTALLVLIALAYSERTMRAVKRRGFRAVVFQ